MVGTENGDLCHSRRSSVLDDSVVEGGSEELDEFSFEEVKLAVDLVSRPREALRGVVRVVADIFQGLPGAPSVIWHIRVWCGCWRGGWLRCWGWRWGGSKFPRLWAVSLTCTKEVADASFVVVAGHDRILSLVGRRLTGDLTIPGLSPVSWLVTIPIEGEIATLLSAGQTTLRRHSKELKPFKVVLSTACSLGVLRRLTTLKATVYDVDGGAESGGHVGCLVFSCRHEEASHDVVHAWLGVLRGHVEPDTSCHGQEAISVHQVGVLKQVVLAVVRAGGKDVGKHTVVVVPR